MSIERVILMRHADYYFDCELNETRITERDCEWGADLLTNPAAMGQLGGIIAENTPILHSNVKRATLTAECLTSHLPGVNMLVGSEPLYEASVIRPWKNPDVPLNLTKFLIDEFQNGDNLPNEAETLLVVTHEPLVAFVAYGGERATHCSPVLLDENAYASRL